MASGLMQSMISLLSINDDDEFDENDEGVGLRLLLLLWLVLLGVVDDFRLGLPFLYLEFS
jgi:hypothetical protein